MTFSLYNKNSRVAEHRGCFVVIRFKPSKDLVFLKAYSDNVTPGIPWSSFADSCSFGNHFLG